MLRTLYIRNFALIDEIEASFGGGLNVITGETGAGKSIVVGALKLLLGARSSPELVRTGEEKAVVEGSFDISRLDHLRKLLEEEDLDAGPTLVIRREVRLESSRAFVNDSPVKVETLKRIAGGLADLHGQHEHQSVLRSDTHLPLLDGIGTYRDVLSEYRSVFRRLRELVNEQARLGALRDRIRRDRELAEFQIAEIDAVSPHIDEEQELSDELNILDHVEQLVEGTQTAFETLYGGDDSVYDRLAAVMREIDDLQRFDASLAPYLDDLRTSASVISDIASFLRDYEPGTEMDAGRATEIRERLGAFEMLKRKYGGAIEAVLRHREEIGAQIDEADSFDAALVRIAQDIAQLRPKLSELAHELTIKREEEAAVLEEAVVAELAQLGMADARFEVRLYREPDPAGLVETSSGDRVRAFEDGSDVCEFFLSANRGEPPKPLVKVASGGEASRVMLALKTILARSDSVSTLVFDEIDTGISGAVGERVGAAMRKLSQSHQVIAITHLPQIAAAADDHYSVTKHVIDERTTTRFTRLDDEARAREIASLLSGSEISSAALQSARELIGR